MPQIILASASPRRRELLDQISIRYTVQSADVDERVHSGEDPLAYVTRIAAAKSAAVQSFNAASLPVLAADTSVVHEGLILGKPVHREAGIAMLQRLSGCTHQVYTAVSLRTSARDIEQHWQAVSVTQVSFRSLTLDEINAYWNTGEPIDKAGGYAIQGLASAFVVTLQGSYSGVVGLPLFETANLLENVGIKIVHD